MTVQGYQLLINITGFPHYPMVCHSIFHVYDRFELILLTRYPMYSLAYTITNQ